MIIPIVGLAVDAGVLFVLKTMVSASADAAAIAAARSLSVGLTIDAQKASATADALAFFNANMKPGSYGTKNQSVAIDIAESSYRTRTVTVTAQLDAPQYFMRYLGFNSTHIVASGKASRRDVNLMLVLDRSGSMKDSVPPAADNGAPCTTMRNAAATFVNMFAEERDRLGLITYGGSWYLSFAPSKTFKTGSPSMLSRIASISCNGGTGTGTALWNAYDQVSKINEPGTLNMIVLFTDGYANLVHANFPVRTASDTRYGYTTGYKQWSTTNKSYSGTTTCSSYSTSCTMEPSPCVDPSGNLYDRNAGQTTRNYTAPNWNPNYKPSPIRGGLTQAAGDTYSLGTGATYGLITEKASSATDVNDPIVSAAGCAFTTDYPGNNNSSSNRVYNNGNSSTPVYPTNVRRDIAFMPDIDVNNVNTDGYKDILRYSSGSYVNRKRVDRPMDVTGAGMNVADNVGILARNDNTIKPALYTIGLGSNGGVDHELLRRIANDPASPVYDDTKMVGMYAYAPTPTDLNQAFVRIASEILRIAQ
ncbi:VWA domain-containing protein [uncultured Paludibaculum sp.]|uniref:VWA domain-containing protein n=1 Tax=uncultured Paludibaculum sp. TaxID=1765020 RepID=UPI002AAABAF4|nr:VWA domain-containing protein [uncultured Paludibaculum sp.]